MQRPPEVRKATVADADVIARVHVASWQSAYRGLVPDTVLDELSVEKRAAGWREWLPKVDESRTWVAEQDGEIVGFVNAGRCRDDDAAPGTGEINAIYVSADMWDTGVGAALMNEAVSYLHSEYMCATLWVLEGNDRGRRFYEKGGWSPDGRSQKLDFGGTDLPEMRYRIDF
jgi:GNAT superfamily N-acetyltransferase